MVAMRYRVAPATVGIFGASAGKCVDPQQSVVQGVAAAAVAGLALGLVILFIDAFETL